MSENTDDLADVAKNTTLDFYSLLNVQFESSEKEIRKSYRTAALKYHPDKAKDNPNAADIFLSLAHGRDILLSPTLKPIYDAQRLRKREKARQEDLLTGRRLQLKKDLEERERAGVGTKRKRMDDPSEAEADLWRLQEDGRRRRQEMERKRQEKEAPSTAPNLEEEVKPPASGQSPELDRTIKVRLYDKLDKETLSNMFGRWGEIEHIVVGNPKKIRPSGLGHKVLLITALIVYKRIDQAHAAIMDMGMDAKASQIESVTWAGKAPDIKSPMAAGVSAASAPSAPSTPQATPNKSFRASFNGGLDKGLGSTPGTPKFSFSPRAPSLEETTMMRLKEAEKKRLEEQIRQQEAAEEAV